MLWGKSSSSIIYLFILFFSAVKVGTDCFLWFLLHCETHYTETDMLLFTTEFGGTSSLFHFGNVVITFVEQLLNLMFR